MTTSFKDYIREHIVVLQTAEGSMPLDQLGWYDAINEELATIFEFPFVTLDIAYSRLRESLSNYNLYLPLFSNAVPETESEDVYAVESAQPCFLYVAYFQMEGGLYECYAEFMDEEVLHDLLSLDDTDDSSVLPT